MHEMYLAESVITLLEEASIKQGFTHVNAIWVEVGLLSHVEPEALVFCFDAVSENTLAENAVLHIILVKGLGFCDECNKTFSYDQLYDPCPYCDTYQVNVIAGDQMRLKNLEVE